MSTFPYNVHNQIIEEKPEEHTSQEESSSESAVYETNFSKELADRFKRATTNECEQHEMTSNSKSETGSFVQDCDAIVADESEG